MTPEDVQTFERCISVGGVALFPADTVYGLATEPDSREGVDRLYALKGRRPERPAAVMFFQLELALEALPVLQSSANPSGGRDPRRLSEVDPRILHGVDMQLDGGELPGTPSSVVDLTGWGSAGED